MTDKLATLVVLSLLITVNFILVKPVYYMPA